MKACFCTILGLACLAGFGQRSSAITIEELGTTGEIVEISCTGLGNVWVEAGAIQLNVDGQAMNGFCIDPFHFSSGSMPGYQKVGLTSAPKDNLMDANTAQLLERLWGSYYSSSMSHQDAAGLQIAIWRLVGGNCFSLASQNDYGAATFLSAVEDPNYSGPVSSLEALTGPGQDYAIASFTQSVPDTCPTLALMLLAGSVLLCVPRREFRLVPVRK